MTVATETYVLDDRGRQVILKDPDAVLDYSQDWSEWLDLVADSLDSWTVSAEAGASIVVASPTEAAGVVTAFISGGTPGRLEPVTFHVVTVGDRIDDRTIYLKIAER